MEKIIGNLDGIIVVQDDILIGGVDQKSLNAALDEVLTKLDKAGMSINYRKTVHFSDEIAYLGYKINAKGIHPDPRLVEKVSNILPPKNKKRT